MLIRTQRLSDDLLLGLWRLPADMPPRAKRQQERAAAHSLLAAMLGRPVAILHDADGAPRVEGHQISISHTRGFLAILLSRSRRVGVDIEYRSDRIRRIASRFLRPDESASSTDDLLTCWCVKEAVYKLRSASPPRLRPMRVHLDTATADDLPGRRLPLLRARDHGRLCPSSGPRSSTAPSCLPSISCLPKM